MARPFEGTQLDFRRTGIRYFPDGSGHGSYSPYAFKERKYTVLSSASFGQDDHVFRDGNGLFTHYLIEGLKDRSREVDIDRNGKITAKEIYDYVSWNVLIDSGYKQTPQLWPDNADTVIYSYK